MNLKGYRIRFNLSGPVRDLVQHSAVYGVGQVLSRLASFLLLPIYTRYLSPTDYGVIAILDLTVAAFGAVISLGMGAAVNRYHFNANEDAERDRVWWTGLTFLALVSTAALLPIWFSSGALAHLTLGQSVTRGDFYYKLVIPTLWFTVIGQLPDVYLRARKWSGTSVGINFARLLLNVVVNLYFLIILKLGIVGILLGNLITGGMITFVLLVILSKNLGAYGFHSPLIPRLLRFGSPLIITALLAIIIHQADRYFIRVYLDLNQVGIYSFAYTIGQAVNTVVLLPFAAIWNTVVYEIAQRPDAKNFYVQVFEYFVYGLLLVILAVALFSRQILGLLVPESYLPAADLIPVVCLAYFFFSLHEHFKVPVLLEKKTTDLLPVFGIGVFVNTVFNLVLIPRYGPAGAAWASVVSFAVFSFVGLWRYRRIDKYHYPLVRCGFVLSGMVGSYVGYEKFARPEFGLLDSGVATLIWLMWGLFLFMPFLRKISVNGKNMIRDQRPLNVERSK